MFNSINHATVKVEVFAFLCWPRLPDRSVTLGRNQRAFPKRNNYERQINHSICYFNQLICFPFCFVFQIAAKIGGDGVAAPSANEFGYGGQKRPLEDAGGYFPMPNLNIGQ